MTIPGVDYAWSHPGGAAIQRAGYAFACRYSSNDATKDISRQEADDLAAHGVWTVVVRETTANRARAGRAAGIADAKAAVARATTAGMPSGRPLYFAIDYDAPTADKPEICDYFRGVASVIGVARTGGYGGYDQLKWLVDAGLIRWVWQTAAWSGGRLLPGRNIYQFAKTVTLNGVSCDINEARTSDYGQWMPGQTPLVEDDMPITQADAELIAKVIAKPVAVAVASYSHGDDPDVHQTWSTAAVQATAAASGVKTLVGRAPVALTDAQVAAIADRLAGNPAFVAALAAAIPKPSTAAEIADVIAARMRS